jgi:hypothetical protein
MAEIAWWVFVYLPAAVFWLGIVRCAVLWWRFDEP